MKIRQLLKVLVMFGFVLLIVGQPHSAKAAIQVANDTPLYLYGNSSMENPTSFAAEWIVPLSTVCGQIVYIAPEDKQLYALIMSAQVNGLHVNIHYDDAAPPVAFSSSSGWSGTTLHCKLVSVWLQKNGY
jgi:hypothetical protein